MENAQPAAIEPSFAQIRAMMADPAATPVKAEVQAEIETDKAPVVESKPETQQQPESIDTIHEKEEEKLPAGVQKRIQQEVDRTLQIRQAISERKAAQAELDKLTPNPGSEPVKQTDVSKEPVEPDEADAKYSGEGGWGRYMADLKAHRADHSKWIIAETRRTVEQEFTARHKQESAEKQIAEARSNNPELDAQRKVVGEATPQGLQMAISELDDWSGVVKHLATNMNETAELVELFKASPVKAIAKLARIEDRLNQAAKQPTAVDVKPKTEPLPDPLVKPGGSNSNSAPAVNFETAALSTAKAEWRRLMKKSAA